MKLKKALLAASGLLLISAALPAAAEGEYRAKAIAVFKKDFQTRGQAAAGLLPTRKMQRG